MSLPLEVIAWSIVIGCWTFMWLVWSFEADIRAWIVAALFPRRWLAGKARADVAIMSPRSLDSWLVTSEAPLAVCQLLSCRRCYSAHVAGYGTVLVALIGVPLLALPLIWAAGAGIGNLIYDYTKRPH